MDLITNIILKQAEADREKYGYKGLWISTMTNIFRMDEVFDHGFINKSMIIYFASISPIVPMHEEAAMKAKELESGIIQPKSKIIKAN